MRDLYQHQAAALRRINRAVDRFIVAKTPEEKATAKRWATAWAEHERMLSDKVEMRRKRDMQAVGLPVAVPRPQR